MRGRPYGKYRVTGARPLELIPDGWKLLRGRYVMAVNPRCGRLDTLAPDTEVSFVPMEAVGEYGGLRLDQTRAIEEVGTGYTPFEDGDIVVAKITPCFENGKGALASGLTNGMAFGTTELHVLRPGEELDRRFLFYLSVSQFYRLLGEAEMYGAGGQKRVPPDFCRDFPVPLPPLAQQHTIATFLDRETARIDTLIEKKRTLIERLKEKRSALISRTVTRGLPPEAAKAAGLSPHPSMKDSEVEWVGEVPEHWEACQLRRLSTFITSGSRGWAEYYADQGDIFLRITNLTRGSLHLDLREIQYVEAPEGAEGERTRTKAGDLLFSITAYLGSVAVVDDQASGSYVNQHVALVRLRRARAESSFIGYVALSDRGQAQLAGAGYGGTKTQLSLDDVLSMWTPVPPPAEQRAITAWLDSATSQLDELAERADEAIQRLQEYRSALITAAVTGQIDVREAAA